MSKNSSKNSGTPQYRKPKAPKSQRTNVAPNPKKMKNKVMSDQQKKYSDQIRLTGGHGVEVLADMNLAATFQGVNATLPTNSSILPVTVQVSDRSISYLAMGIVLRAIKRGLLSAQLSNEFPYYMFRYLIDAFTSAMLSGTSILVEAPLWYWEIFHALKPKIAKFKTSQIQYKWEIVPSGQSNAENFLLGSGSDPYSIWWGTVYTGQDVDGFPVWGGLPPYTPAGGLEAIATLWSYCSVNTPALIPDPGEAVATYNDTSAFAINYPELGASFNSVGAYRSTIYSERHIDTPLFSKFGVYQSPGTALWRGWHKAGLAAGSSSMIGPGLIDVGANKQRAKNKIAATVKVYNFDEIFEQLSLTMCLASEALATQPGQTPVSCPLSSQQVQLLLRQAIIGQFDNDMFQDLRYDTADRVHLLPFTVGPNGATSGTVDMLLPTFLAENIRCMKGFAASTSKQYKDAVVQWYSVLARPSPMEFPQLQNYLWGPSNTLLYAVLPGEVPINLIECSAPLNQSTVYLDLSREEIQVLKEFWNTYISYYTNVLSPLVSLTSQGGIHALNCNIYTNAIQVAPPPTPTPIAPTTTVLTSRRKSIEGPTSIGVSMSSKRHKVGATPQAGSSYFENIAENEVTSVEAVKPPTWPYLSKWILPVDFVADQINSGTSQGVRAFQVEPFKIPRSSAGGVGGFSQTPASRPDSLTRHLTAAQIDIKAFATLNFNELIQGLVVVAAEGRGGFFTSLVSGLAGMVSPGAAAAVTAVGNALGL